MSASVLTVVMAGGLIAFATFGAFDNRSDPFPRSVSGAGTISGPSPAH